MEKMFVIPLSLLEGRQVWSFAAYELGEKLQKENPGCYVLYRDEKDLDTDVTLTGAKKVSDRIKTSTGQYLTWYYEYEINAGN